MLARAYNNEDTTDERVIFGSTVCSNGLTSLHLRFERLLTLRKSFGIAEPWTRTQIRNLAGDSSKTQAEAVSMLSPDYVVCPRRGRWRLNGMFEAWKKTHRDSVIRGERE